MVKKKKEKKPKREFITIDVGRSIAPAGLAVFPIKRPKYVKVAGGKKLTGKGEWLLVLDIEAYEAKLRYGDEEQSYNVLFSGDILRSKKKKKLKEVA